MKIPEFLREQLGYERCLELTMLVDPKEIKILWVALTDILLTFTNCNMTGAVSYVCMEYLKWGMPIRDMPSNTNKILHAWYSYRHANAFTLGELIDSAKRILWTCNPPITPLTAKKFGEQLNLIIFDEASNEEETK